MASPHLLYESPPLQIECVTYSVPPPPSSHGDGVNPPPYSNGGLVPIRKSKPYTIRVLTQGWVPQQSPSASPPPPPSAASSAPSGSSGSSRVGRSIHLEITDEGGHRGCNLSDPGATLLDSLRSGPPSPPLFCLSSEASSSPSSSPSFLAGEDGSSLPADIAARQLSALMSSFADVLSSSSADGASKHAADAAHDGEPITLHALHVMEDDFHLLKTDQSLLVDFDCFPRFLVELIKVVVRQCSGGGASDADASGGGGLPLIAPSQAVGRYLLRLEEPSPVVAAAAAAAAAQQVGGGGAAASQPVAPPAARSASTTFSILESTPFRELTHLSLSLVVVAPPLAVRHLSTRCHRLLSHTRRQGLALHAGLQGLSSTLSVLRIVERELQAKSSALHQQAAGQRAAVAMAAREADLQAREEGRAALAAAGARSREDARIAREETQAFRARLEAEEAARRDAEGRERDAGSRAALLEEQLKAVERERSRLEKERSDLLGEVVTMREVDRARGDEIRRVMGELAELRGRGGAGEEALSMATKRAEEGAKRAAALERALEEARDGVAEERSKVDRVGKEVEKGNRIIQRLAEEYKDVRAKLKAEKARRQDAERAAKAAEEAKDIAESGARRTNAELAASKAGADQIAADLEQARERLAESAKLLDSNQQVITWLNREINEAQIGGGRSSTYQTTKGASSFKPSFTPELKVQKGLGAYISPEAGMGSDFGGYGHYD